MKTPMFKVTRAGKFVATFRASDIPNLDRARYELALCTGVHGPSVLRGIAREYTDGTLCVAPIDSRGKRLGRPYFFTPYTYPE